MTRRAIDHIYISPHLDDAILSCGGLIHHQTTIGQRVLIVALYTAGLEERELSPSLKAMHDVWGFAGSDPFQTRRSEDIAAARTLGAECHHLGWQGALYRSAADHEFFYQGLSYFGPPTPPDRQQQLARISQVLRDLRAQHPGATLCAPLAIGEHVDHVLTHTASRLVSGPLRFYEDMPYVMVGNAGPIVMRLLARLSRWGMVGANYSTGGAASRLVASVQASTSLFGGPGLTLRIRGNGRSRWHPTLHNIDLSAKINAVELYESQLPMLFGSRIQARQAITHYTMRVGGGSPAERLWHLE